MCILIIRLASQEISLLQENPGNLHIHVLGEETAWLWRAWALLSDRPWFKSTCWCERKKSFQILEATSAHLSGAVGSWQDAFYQFVATSGYISGQLCKCLNCVCKYPALLSSTYSFLSVTSQQIYHRFNNNQPDFTIIFTSYPYSLM